MPSGLFDRTHAAAALLERAGVLDPDADPVYLHVPRRGWDFPLFHGLRVLYMTGAELAAATAEASPAAAEAFR